MFKIIYSVISTIMHVPYVLCWTYCTLLIVLVFIYTVYHIIQLINIYVIPIYSKLEKKPVVYLEYIVPGTTHCFTSLLFTISKTPLTFHLPVILIKMYIVQTRDILKSDHGNVSHWMISWPVYLEISYIFRLPLL